MIDGSDRRLRSLRRALPLVWLTLSGCMAGNIHVEPVAVSAQKPGKVALYVAVSQRGSALADLASESFSVFENGVRLDNQQVQLTLLPTATVEARHVAQLAGVSKKLSAEQRKGLYLVAYCSPARAGTREVRLEVTTQDAQGKKSVGSYETKFDAAGFGPGCNPSSSARFALATSKVKSSQPSPNATKSGSKPASHGSEPRAADSAIKVSSAQPAPELRPNAAAPSADPPSVAEPPTGLGYE